MRRKAKVVLLAVAGAAAGVVLARRRRPAEAPGAPDERSEALRRKLEEAKDATAPPETRGEPERLEPGSPPAEAPAAESPPAEPESPPEPAPQEPAPSEPASPGLAPPGGETAPQDEFEAMRRRIHEEGRAAAEEMRRSTDRPDER